MSGDGHSLATSGSNQGLQGFSSVLQSKLVRPFPVFEHKRGYQSAFFLSPFSFVKQLSKKDWFWSMYFTTIHSGTVDVGSSNYVMKNFTTKGWSENIWSLIVPCCSLTPVFKDGTLAYSCYSVTGVHARLSTAEVQQGFARDRLVLVSCSASISSPALQKIRCQLLHRCLTIFISSGPLNPQQAAHFAFSPGGHGKPGTASAH